MTILTKIILIGLLALFQSYVITLQISFYLEKMGIKLITTQTKAIKWLIFSVLTSLAIFFYLALSLLFL